MLQGLGTDLEPTPALADVVPATQKGRGQWKTTQPYDAGQAQKSQSGSSRP